MAAMYALIILSLVATYMAVLFVIAWRSERSGQRSPGRRFGPWAYALSLAIYCTSWTYYGAVGTAARDGWEYLPIYLGPVLGIVVLFPIWKRIAAAAKRENIGSIADFGFWVELKEVMAEGMVRLSSLSDDYYTFFPERQELIGERDAALSIVST